MELESYTWQFAKEVELYGMLFASRGRHGDFYPTSVYGPIKLPPGEYCVHQAVEYSDAQGKFEYWIPFELPRNVRQLLKEHRLLNRRAQNLLSDRRIRWFVKGVPSAVLQLPNRVQRWEMLRQFPVFQVTFKDHKGDPKRNVLYQVKELSLPGCFLTVSHVNESLIAYDQKHQPQTVVQVLAVESRLPTVQHTNISTLQASLKGNECWVVRVSSYKHAHQRLLT